jgi:polyphosphate kinase
VSKYNFINRELSWLSFNHRVLQEARDPNVPVFEKIKFMAIFSSNLDEFYRVRVASLRNLLALKRKTQKKLEFDPVWLLKKIFKSVDAQQEELGTIYRNIVLEELAENLIYIINESQLDSGQAVYIKRYFQEHVRPYLQPAILFKKKVSIFLQNKSIYLAIKLSSKETSNVSKYAVVEIPTSLLPRFIVLPKKEDKNFIILLDDVIRYSLSSLFPGYKIDEVYAIKLTRDAELYIEDEFSGDLVEKIKKGLSKRKTGVPSRFLYDSKMPDYFLNFLKDAFKLNNEDLFPGGRYHNFSDFFNFPNLGFERLEYKKILPQVVKNLESSTSIMDTMNKQDVLLYYPYQSYDYVIRFLKEAAHDPQVTHICITLYRVASDSQIIKNLVLAVKQGKDVTVFVEVKARFDEESNIQWAEELKNKGVHVLYSFPGLKVHAKLCLISRKEKGSIKEYAYLATGNFNENTAKVYTDLGLFTADGRLTKEVRQIFEFLSNKNTQYKYQNMFVAPFNMRQEFYQLIEQEIKMAKLNRKAEIYLKLNSLQDKKIIEQLYKASNAGVKIYIIVRGICCLIPGIKGMSENIQAISIIDRFLEHSRIYIFHNGGQIKIYVSSADWMQRNLSRRIEVAFPIYSRNLKKFLIQIFDILWSDNLKARIIDKSMHNSYKKNITEQELRSQTALDEYINVGD